MEAIAKDNLNAQTEEVRELIADHRFLPLKKTLSELEIHDLAELLGNLTGEDELAIAFRVLPTERAAEVLGELETDQQEDLITKLSKEKVAEIINEMPPDDRTELLEEMPGKIAQRLMNQLRGNERKIAQTLLAYPEDSIGRLMTPEYIAVRKDWTIDHVLRHIRKRAAGAETFNIIYIVDENWKLVDEISLEQVVLAEPEQEVEELMDEQFGALHASDDQEDAIEAFKKYDAVALPVVDGRGTLVGIVTHDDMLDVQEEEDTEDMQKMAGMTALEYSYFSAGFWPMLKSRLPWLILLLIAETGAVLVLNGYHLLLATLAMFMPLINATAGNTGSQVAGLMIRAFAVNEITGRDWIRVFRRELFRGLFMGLLLAGLACMIVVVVGGPADSEYPETDIAMAVGIAMIFAVTLANLIGAMLPFLFHGIGADPAVTSGPFIACLMDIGSILIFFSTASLILNIAL